MQSTHLRQEFQQSTFTHEHESTRQTRIIEGEKTKQKNSNSKTTNPPQIVLSSNGG